MKIHVFSSILLLILFYSLGNAQDKEVIIGKDNASSTAAVYDLSDPMNINIEVNLWGFVRYPGRYKIPYNTTFLDLISYAGGPIEESNLKEIRLFRLGTDSLSKKNQIIKLNYEDLVWEEKVKSVKINPVLEAGDIIIVMQERRYTFRDNMSFILPIFSTVLTIATFIITIIK